MKIVHLIRSLYFKFASMHVYIPMHHACIAGIFQNSANGDGRRPHSEAFTKLLYKCVASTRIEFQLVIPHAIYEYMLNNGVDLEVYSFKERGAMQLLCLTD